MSQFRYPLFSPFAVLLLITACTSPTSSSPSHAHPTPTGSTLAGVVTTLAGGGIISVGYEDGTGAAALFNVPYGVAADSSGNLYVADTSNNLIRKITVSGVVTTLAGGGSAGGISSGYVDATGTNAEFCQPEGVAVDSSGNVYVADTGNNLIRKITSLGVVTTLAGGGSVGGTNPGYVDATGTNAEFNLPSATAVDSSGNVYVADTGNNLIRKITSSGVVTTFAGGGSVGGTAPGYVDATGTAAMFISPQGAAVDSSGNVYVADTGNNLIRKITSSGVVTTFAGGGSMGGTSGGSLDGTGTNAEFSQPWAVAADASGNVYVADASNNLIRKITSSGVVTTLAGGGSVGGTAYGKQNGTGRAATFSGPSGVAADASGNVYVADDGNSLIRKITSSGVVTTLAGGGNVGGLAPGNQNGTGIAATFYKPVGVAADTSGNIYVADQNNNVIRKITSSGVVTTLAGGGSVGGSTSGHANGTGTAATFNQPAGVAVDASGNVYVADLNNHLIRKITSTGVVTTLAGVGGASGHADGTGTAATFNAPTELAVDASGNVYVADTRNHLIRKITSAGVVTTLAGGGSAGGVASGHADGTGTAATFFYPSGITLDSSGNLYVTDSGNNLIRKITPAGVVTTLAGGGGAGGVANGHADGTGTSATFDTPIGITMDSSANLYVADAASNLIRKITSAGVVTTLAGGGSAGGTASGSANGTGNTATFYYPYGAAMDSSGNLYIADSQNNLIRKIR